MRLIKLVVLASTAFMPVAAMAQGAGDPSQPNQASEATQTRRVAVSNIEGREVYTAQGQAIGQIDTVVLGQNSQPFAVVSFDEFLGMGGEARLVPLARMTLQGDRAVIPNMRDAEFRSLRTYRANMAGFREADQNQQVALGAQAQPNQQRMAQNQSGQGGSRVVVQQTAPTIRVDPADPRVIVRQAQPQVTVNQAQPEIIVRQPQPTVQVDIPQPEIIVRMPQPDVNVAMAQPDVRVLMEQPDVSVVQPNQPQVQVERAQPQVLVQRSANGEPEVQVQQAEGQPTVRYEQAQPQVIVNQAQGQPDVRIERQDSGQQAAARDGNQPPQQPATAQSSQQQAAVQQTQPQGQQTQSQQNSSNQSASTPRISDPAALGGTVAPPPPRPEAQQQQTAAGSVYSEEQRRTIRERVNAGDAETTGAVDANVQMRPVAVSSLEDMNVYNARGEELGEVDRVIVTPQDRRFVVVGAGGFLGIGRDRVAFPLERFWMRGDRLVIRGVTEQDIEAMDDYRDTVDSFQRVSRNEQTELRVWR